MKRKYEFQTRVKGVTLQVEESDCPDTIVLSVGFDGCEFLALCLSRTAWEELRSVGGGYQFSHSCPDFTWAKPDTSNTNTEVTK